MCRFIWGIWTEGWNTFQSNGECSLCLDVCGDESLCPPYIHTGTITVHLTNALQHHPTKISDIMVAVCSEYQNRIYCWVVIVFLILFNINGIIAVVFWCSGRSGIVRIVSQFFVIIIWDVDTMATAYTITSPMVSFVLASILLCLIVFTSII